MTAIQVSDVYSKYRLLPNQVQRNWLVRIGIASAILRNHVTDYIKKEHKREESIVISFPDNDKLEKIYRSLCLKKPWIAEVPKHALTETVKSYVATLKKTLNLRVANLKMVRIKNPKRTFCFKATWLNFSEKGAEFLNGSNIQIKFSKGSTKVPFTLGNIVVRSTKDGNFWIEFKSQSVSVRRQINLGSVIGVDVGLHKLAIVDDETFKNPRLREMKEDYLNILGFKLNDLRRLYADTSQVKGLPNKQKRLGAISKRLNAVRLKLARAKAKIANQMYMTLKQIAEAIVNKADIICIETLNQLTMSKFTKRARKDAKWNQLHKDIIELAKKQSKVVVHAAHNFPSTNTCNVKFQRFTDEQNIVDKTGVFICPVCNFPHDRDQNASLNLQTYGRLAASNAALKNGGILYGPLQIYGDSSIMAML